MSIILEMLTLGFRLKVARDGGLEDGTLKFVLPNHGFIFIDGNQIPNTVSNDDRIADCTVTTEASTLLAMITGEVDGVRAFRHGKIVCEGDLRILMVMGPIGVSRTEAASGAPDWEIPGNLRFPFSLSDPTCDPGDGQKKNDDLK
jgi:putative sterol carrier protein